MTRPNSSVISAIAVMASYAAVPANALDVGEAGLAYAEEKCGAALARYRNVVTFQDLDPWDTGSAGWKTQAEPGTEPIAAWMMSTYSLMNELSMMGSSTWPDRDRRETAAVAIDAALDLEKCLTPSEAAWSQFDDVTSAGRSEELRSGHCLLPSATSFRDLLRSDLGGEELSGRIAALRAEQSAACQRKN